jgi:hypothetical protein
LNDGQIQNPSNPFGIVPLSNFVPRSFGFVHHSTALLSITKCQTLISRFATFSSQYAAAAPAADAASTAAAASASAAASPASTAAAQRVTIREITRVPLRAHSPPSLHAAAAATSRADTQVQRWKTCESRD